MAIVLELFIVGFSYAQRAQQSTTYFLCQIFLELSCHQHMLASGLRQSIDCHPGKNVLACSQSEALFILVGLPAYAKNLICMTALSDLFTDCPDHWYLHLVARHVRYR